MKREVWFGIAVVFLMAGLIYFDNSGIVELSPRNANPNSFDLPGANLKASEKDSIFCGNGVLERGEECDDGNSYNGDGCSAECLLEGGPTSIDVCFKQELRNVENNLLGTYRQICDIDLSGEEFEPIGSLSEPFMGNYDGQGYKIIGLNYNNQEEDGVGLFSATLNSRIENINLENVDLIGKDRVGSLVGFSQDSEIINVNSNGFIEGNSFVGGIAGVLTAESLLLDSSANIKVSGAQGFVGGLAGSLDGFSVLENSNSLGEVNAFGARIGGAIGSLSFLSKVENSYAEGDVVSEQGSLVGGFVGFCSGSSINKSHATGEINVGQDVSAVGGFAGGCIAENVGDSTIENSYSSGNIVGGEAWIGGLVGYTKGLSIFDVNIIGSYSEGDVDLSSGTRVGGLVGSAEDLGLSDSYALGKVKGEDSIGGLIGYVADSNVKNSYSVGRVQGSSNFGGLIGLGGGTPIISSYWDIETSGQSFSSGGGEGKSTSEMMDKNTFVNWDFDNIWAIAQGESYPFLSWQEG